VALGAFDQVAGEGGSDEGADGKGDSELDEVLIKDEATKENVEDDGGDASDGFRDLGDTDGLFVGAT